MTQNLITSAFELVRDVEQGVLLLDTFHRLASREVPPHPPPPRPARLLLCLLQFFLILPDSVPPPVVPSHVPPRVLHRQSLFFPLLPEFPDGPGRRCPPA